MILGFEEGVAELNRHNLTTTETHPSRIPLYPGNHDGSELFLPTWRRDDEFPFASIAAG